TMGFNKERGDSLNVLNSPFVTAEKEVPVEPVYWKNPEYIAMAKEGGRYLLIAVVLLLMYLKMLRPLLRTVSPPPPALPNNSEGQAALENGVDEDGAVVELSGGALPAPKQRSYQENLEAAKALARQDPRMVANIVKNWVDGNE
ncbi:MAG: flagellar basal body M-ring protein FliF, partial [Burkholderiaceae bacterium]